DEVDLELDTNNDIIADAEYILNNKPNIIDSRSVQEYMQGKIPNAINIPWESNIEKDRIFADRDYIANNLKDVDNNIVCYCTHGIRAAHMFASLRLIGKDNVRVYDGSIMDWVSKRLPIE
ncbi:MAG: sulfurtransferase, partial [Candidatus Nitrosothermus koennekii]